MQRMPDRENNTQVDERRMCFLMLGSPTECARFAAELSTQFENVRVSGSSCGVSTHDVSLRGHPIRFIVPECAVMARRPHLLQMLVPGGCGKEIHLIYHLSLTDVGRPPESRPPRLMCRVDDSQHGSGSALLTLPVEVLAHIAGRLSASGRAAVAGCCAALCELVACYALLRPNRCAPAAQELAAVTRELMDRSSSSTSTGVIATHVLLGGRRQYEQGIVERLAKGEYPCIHGPHEVLLEEPSPLLLARAISDSLLGQLRAAILDCSNAGSMAYSASPSPPLLTWQVCDSWEALGCRFVVHRLIANVLDWQAHVVTAAAN